MLEARLHKGSRGWVQWLAGRAQNFVDDGRCDHLPGVTSLNTLGLQGHGSRLRIPATGGFADVCAGARYLRVRHLHHKVRDPVRLLFVCVPWGVDGELALQAQSGAVEVAGGSIGAGVCRRSLVWLGLATFHSEENASASGVGRRATHATVVPDAGLGKIRAWEWSGARLDRDDERRAPAGLRGCLLRFPGRIGWLNVCRPPLKH